MDKFNLCILQVEGWRNMHKQLKEVFVTGFMYGSEAFDDMSM